MIKFKYWIPIFTILVSIVLIVLVLFYNEKENGRFNIITTFHPIELIVNNLIDGVEGTTNTNISASIGGCIHNYEMTSNDVKKMENADLIVINGQGMEHFMNKVTINNNIVDSSENIPNGNISSHIWMDIDNYIMQIRNICNALCKYDSVNSEKYINNMNEYIINIEEIKNSIKINGNTKVAIMNDSFKYYANIGMFDISTHFFAGHEGDYSANSLKNFIESIKDTNTKILFVDNETCENNMQLVNSIKNETDVKVYVLDLMVDESDNPNEYIQKMTENIRIMEEALEYAE